MLFFNLLSQFKSTIKTIFIAHYDVFCAVIFVFLGHIALIAAISFWQNKTPLKNVVATSPEVILNLVAPIVPNKPVQPSVAKTKPITIPKVIRPPKAVTLPKTIAPPKSTNLPKTVAPPKPVDVPKPVNTITPQQLTTVVQAVTVTDTQKISDVLPTTIQPVKSAPTVSTTSNAISNAVVPSNTSSNTSSNTPSDTSNNEVSRTVQTSVKTPVIFNADYLNNPTPVYPNISRLRGETGKVLLRVSVNRNGQAASIELHRSSGSSKLDEAAIRTVRLWNFVPAKVDGNPVDSTVIVPIDFKLD